MSSENLLTMDDLDVEEASIFVWPPTNTEPTVESGGYYCNGTYSDNLMCVSPEGYVYGKEQRIKFWPHYMWWDGASWVEIEVAGRAASVATLPPGPRPFGQIWQAHVYDRENEHVFLENLFLGRYRRDLASTQMVLDGGGYLRLTESGL